MKLLKIDPFFLSTLDLALQQRSRKDIREFFLQNGFSTLESEREYIDIYIKSDTYPRHIVKIIFDDDKPYYSLTQINFLLKPSRFLVSVHWFLVKMYMRQQRSVLEKYFSKRFGEKVKYDLIPLPCWDEGTFVIILNKIENEKLIEVKICNKEVLDKESEERGLLN